jgi:hypothetical protein
MAALARKPAKSAAGAKKVVKAPVKAPAAAPSSPRSRKAESAAKANAKSPKTGKQAVADKKPALVLPKDALIIDTGPKSAFVGTYNTFKDDDGTVHNTVLFTKGYRRDDGELTLTGKSGTIPRAMLTGPKGKKNAKLIADWILSFAN